MVTMKLALEHWSHPFTTHPTDEFQCQFLFVAYSKMQIRQFLLQLKAPSPVSAIAVNIVLFLGEGSRH